MKSLLWLALGGTLCAAAFATTPERMALRELSARAASGDAGALRRLAYIHETGFDSISPDAAEATRLYGEAARLGDAQGASLYGFRLITGEGVVPDTTQGVKWIYLAAMQGDPRAANNMGWLLTSGTGMPVDSVKAAEWYYDAASAGLPAGAYNLVGLVESGAVEAPSDSLMAPVYALLGGAYSRGQGVPYSFPRSVEYFLHAAVAGDVASRRVIAEMLQQMPDALDALPLDSLLRAWPGAPTPDMARDPFFWEE
ncbi:MAG: sel1 repeat family protein [Muribaculaceae bacterium]|nr:sel1 repeat family protein [Muribaculaceae bacterium]